MSDLEQQVTDLLAGFRLPTASQEMVPRLRDADQHDALPVVHEVLQAEADSRMDRRVERLRKASKLPIGKTMASLDMKRFPVDLRRKLRDVAAGAFLDDAVNVLAFGLPGTGKTHACCAIGTALVEAGHSVLFTPAFSLVQDLLAAKRDLALPRALRKLDAFELLILDDIGYIKQRPDEVEVLFTLMAERYERRSLMLTSNLVFSEWDQIFQNPMTTAAAIDRLVHHSVILEFDVPSYRSGDKTADTATNAAAKVDVK
jgi:DNA replication protein DnaC